MRNLCTLGCPYYSKESNPNNDAVQPKGKPIIRHTCEISEKTYYDKLEILTSPCPYPIIISQFFKEHPDIEQEFNETIKEFKGYPQSETTLAYFKSYLEKICSYEECDCDEVKIIQLSDYKFFVMFHFERHVIFDLRVKTGLTKIGVEIDISKIW